MNSMYPNTALYREPTSHRKGDDQAKDNTGAEKRAKWYNLGLNSPSTPHSLLKQFGVFFSLPLYKSTTLSGIFYNPEMILALKKVFTAGQEKET